MTITVPMPNDVLVDNAGRVTRSWRQYFTALTSVTNASYTDEMAQDAIGTILLDTATIDFIYDDATPTISANVKDNSITFGKMQAIADGVLLGASGGTAVEEITVSTGLSLVANALSCTITQYTDEMVQDVASTMIQNGTGITWSYNDGAGTLTPTVSITSIVGITGTLAEFNTALTGADFASGGGTVTGASSGTNTGDQTITLTGDVTGAGTGTFAATVVNPILKPTVSVLTDGATPALDASLGTVFTLTAAGDRTIAVPTNPVSGQKIIIAHTASGADRTLALNSGAGGFRFGTDITALTATTSAKTDYIGCIYNLAATRWDVVAYSKGY